MKSPIVVLWTTMFFCVELFAVKPPFCDLAELIPIVPLRADQIHYREFGDPKGEPLILIHGLDSAWQTFENVIPELAKKHRVIVYDQRGHGKTEAVGENYSSGVMAMDLKVLMDHLKLQKATILGHSMGGRTAVKFASMHPDRVKSIIVEDMEMIPRGKDSAEKRMESIAKGRQLAELFKNPTFKDRKALVKALEPIYGQEAESLSFRRAKENDDGTMTLLFRPNVSYLYGVQANLDDLGPALKSINAPILFMRADPSRGTAMSARGTEHVEETVPTAHVELIGGSGHAMHRTNPNEFVDLLTHFTSNGTVTPEYRGKFAKPSVARPSTTGAKPEIEVKIVKLEPAKKKSEEIHNNLRDSGMHPMIATEGVEFSESVRSAKMLPRGSALMTSAGNLARTGITNIIHAASGSMIISNGEFNPTLQSIGWTVANSLTLAQKTGHKRVAIPFIGGKIFASRIGAKPEEIAAAIIDAALARRDKTEIRFVLFSADEKEMFDKILKARGADKTDGAILAVEGSITDFRVHGASAIVNAANMEVKFGGGLSGAIARSTGNDRQIDDEAAIAMKKFNDALKPLLK